MKIWLNIVHILMCKESSAEINIPKLTVLLRTNFNGRIYELLGGFSLIDFFFKRKRSLIADLIWRESLIDDSKLS